jgi:rod shape-determining protein MreD
MDKGFKLVLLSLLLFFIALLLQLTLFQVLKINNITPDLGLIVLVFIATSKGVMAGQAGGFLLGLMQGFAGGIPITIGFNAFVKTIIGFLFGLTEGTISVSSSVMPVLLVGAGTIMKGVLGAIVALLFGIPDRLSGDFLVFLGNLGIETLYTAVLSPFIFLILRRIKYLKPEKSEVY